MTPANSLSLRATMLNLDDTLKMSKSHAPDLSMVAPAIAPIGVLPCPPSPVKPKQTVIIRKSRTKSRTAGIAKSPTAKASQNVHVSETLTDLKAKSPDVNNNDGVQGSTSSSATLKLPNLCNDNEVQDTNQSEKSAIKELTGSENTEPKKKKSKKTAILNAIKPENAEEEKEKFMKSNFQYNPQLTYKNPPRDSALAKFSKPSNRLLHVAEKVLHRVMGSYGSYERFMERTAGRKMSRYECLEAAKTYLIQEGMLGEVSVKVTDDILARACMTRVKGQPTLQIRSGTVRANWMDGIMRHEIGTHYTRSSNNRLQIWRKWKKRKDMELGPANPTEEGLAALHSIIFRTEPSLFRSALLYYTAYQASRLSFMQLFQDIGRFVQDPHLRWDYCMRAKRGQDDTEKPGAFAKDQVYLRGAIEILKHRKTLDFHALVKCGKVDHHDIDRLKEIADLENTRLPSFMIDLNLYRQKLGEILEWNGLTDQDLQVGG